MSKTESAQVTEPTSAMPNTELSKVRELLFGEMASELMAEIAALKDALSRAQSDQDKRSAQIEDTLKAAKGDLEGRLKALAGDSAGDLERMNAQLSAELESLEAQSREAIAQLEASASEQLAQLEDKMQAQLALKTDRAALAAQLRAMADAIAD